MVQIQSNTTNLTKDLAMDIANKAYIPVCIRSTVRNAHQIYLDDNANTY